MRQRVGKIDKRIRTSSEMKFRPVFLRVPGEHGAVPAAGVVEAGEVGEVDGEVAVEAGPANIIPSHGVNKERTLWNKYQGKFR